MIDVPFTVDQIIDACRASGRVNGMHDGCYIRPLVFLGYGEMGLNPLPCPVNVSVAAGRGAPTWATRASPTA